MSVDYRWFWTEEGSLDIHKKCLKILEKRQLLNPSLSLHFPPYFYQHHLAFFAFTFFCGVIHSKTRLIIFTHAERKINLNESVYSPLSNQRLAIFFWTSESAANSGLYPLATFLFLYHYQWFQHHLLGRCFIICFGFAGCCAVRGGGCRVGCCCSLQGSDSTFFAVDDVSICALSYCFAIAGRTVGNCQSSSNFTDYHSPYLGCRLGILCEFYSTLTC